MKRFSLSMQIGIVVSFLILGNIAFAILAFDRMGAMNLALSGITGNALPRVSEGFSLRDIMRRVAVSERALLSEDTKEGSARVAHELGDLSALFERDLKVAYNGSTVAGKETIIKAQNAFGKWKDVEQQVQSLVLEGHTSAALQLANDKSAKLMQEIQMLLTQYVNACKNAMDEETELTDVEYSKARNLLMTGLVAIVLVGASLAFVIMFRLTRSINQIVDHLNATTGKVTLAAQQIAMSSGELSESVTRQAHDLDRTTRRVREMGGVVQKNAAHATKACELSLYSESAAKKGSGVVAQMLKAITEIDEANGGIMREIDASNQRVAEIVKVIGEISEKTRVINEIVFQTKLLSFNASAEATRAGEHGRGFAIVADEIRSLAQSSGAAARDITLMIDGSVAKVDEIVAGSRERVGKLVEECGVKVKTGTRVAGECEQVLGEIVSQVSEVNKMAFEISNASDLQAEGITDLFKTFKSIESETNDTAMVAVETSKVGEHLIEESKSQRQVVAVLIRAVRGGSGPAPALNRPLLGPNPSPENENATTQARSEPRVEPAPGLAIVSPEPVAQITPQAEPASAPAAAAADNGNGNGKDGAVAMTNQEDRAVVLDLKRMSGPPPTEPVMSDTDDQKAVGNG